MQSPSKIFQEMNIALAFCVKFPGLSTMLCFQSIKYFKNYYCNQSKRSSFSLVNGAKKGVRFFSCSFSFMFVFFHVRFLSCSFSFMYNQAIEKRVNILQYFANSNVSVLPKCSTEADLGLLQHPRWSALW